MCSLTFAHASDIENEGRYFFPIDRLAQARPITIGAIFCNSSCIINFEHVNINIHKVLVTYLVGGFPRGIQWNLRTYLRTGKKTIRQLQLAIASYRWVYTALVMADPVDHEAGSTHEDSSMI